LLVCFFPDLKTKEYLNADSTGLTAISISITVLRFGHCIETLIKPIPALGSLGQAEKRGQSREKHSGGGEGD